MEQQRTEIQDCRKCENLIWNFDFGRFQCTILANQLVEDLHIIPGWCPLPEAAKIDYPE